MKIKLFFFAFTFLTLISCEQILDNYWERREQENYVSPYTGNYVGTFSGNENGTLEIKVSKDDGVTVTLSSSSIFPGETYNDNLIGAAFNGGASPNSGFRLFGNLSSPTNHFSGTWQRGNSAGTWELTRQ